MAKSKKGHPHCIIPILGPTGSGKSYFVNQLFGRAVTMVGHSITNSCTSDLLPVEVPASFIRQYLPGWDHQAGTKLIIVDTPGFDDTGVLEAEVLERISRWLAHSYGPNAKLGGAIYLQDISQCRVTGAIKRDLATLYKLCDADACQSVVFGTTKWSRIPDQEFLAAEGREKMLREIYWKDMIHKGSEVKRVDDRPLSAWNLVETVLSGRPPLILVLGLTGTGKSRFILSAEPVGEKPHINSSCSSSRAPVQAFEVSKGAHIVLLVDTPGFNNTEKPDEEVLGEIISWLKSRESENVAGVIYLFDNSNRGYPPLTIDKLKNPPPVAFVTVQCHEKQIVDEQNDPLTRFGDDYRMHHFESTDKGEVVWNAIEEILAHKTRIPARSVNLEGILTSNRDRGLASNLVEMFKNVFIFMN